MEELIFALIIFIVGYLLYLLLIISRKKKLDKFMKGTEVNYLKGRYRLKLDKVSSKLVANMIAVANALIISITFLIITLVENYILKLMVAFVVLMPLILGIYHLIALYIRKKEK